MHARMRGFDLPAFYDINKAQQIVLLNMYGL